MTRHLHAVALRTPTAAAAAAAVWNLACLAVAVQFDVMYESVTDS